EVRFEVLGKQAEAGDDAAGLRVTRWDIGLREGDGAALLGCVSASAAHGCHAAQLLLALGGDELSVRALHETQNIIMGHPHPGYSGVYGIFASVDRIFLCDEAKLQRLDELRMRDPHGMQISFELGPPEGKKAVKHRKARGHIIVLQDVTLKKDRMVRQAVKVFGRGKAITG